MWNEKEKQKDKNGYRMTNKIFDINNINKKDILIKYDEDNNKYCFILIDVKTCNGISRKCNSIVQLSFMFLGTNYIYDSYTKPQDSIPWIVNNKYFKSDITKNIVKFSPNLKDVLLSFLNIISSFDDTEPIFVAHNSSFDKDILKLCFNFYDIKFEYSKWCNTMNKNFFNMRNSNGKIIRSLKHISQTLLNEEENDFNNNLHILYKCLLKLYNCDGQISSIIFKNININEKNKMEKINKSDIEKINISILLDKYYYIISKEKEILKQKNIIENMFKKILKSKDYIISDNKKIMFKEITFKDFIEENIIKKQYKNLCITDV